MEKEIYRRKVLGCWLGKAVGGTLGQNWEGCSGMLSLDFYDPVPAEMIANDDLDTQVVWACKLATEWNGEISRHKMAAAWPVCINNPCDEYGVAIRNFKLGIPAPYTGIFDNFFHSGMGAAIRSEIWAALAPGKPELAAKYAYEDACVDHYGDGIYAEQFLAALESAAFCESDIRKLIETGLSVIPEDSRLYRAVSDTIKWCGGSESADLIQEKILQKYDDGNFTNVLVNLPFIVAAMLMGEGDFSKTICLAVNFGQDADCTGASTASIMGIINPDIPEKWLAPIGHSLVLSKGISGITPPSTLEEFTELIIDLHDKIYLGDTSMPPESDLSKFQIKFRRSIFEPWFPRDPRKFKPVLAADAEQLSFPGNLIEVDFSGQGINALQLLETEFHLDKMEKIILLVSSAANIRVWVDGEFSFACESGFMLPAFHRAPMNHRRDLTLSAGKHKLMIGIARPDMKTEKIPLLFGIASMDWHWIPNAFYKS